MKLCVFTICLDSFPFITWHLPVFNRLAFGWRWIIAEGAAQNVKCTSWCKPQPARLSQDGTSEYLNSIRHHPRVTIIQRESWAGKVEQVNACLAEIKEPCVLLEVDSDETWTADQLARLVAFFTKFPHYKSARFFCRYYVGQNILITSTNGYGNRPGEWHRAWKFTPGQTFKAHEPPILDGPTDPCATREQTKKMGLVFDHYAYAFEKSVAFKEKFYNYPDAVAHWRRLQANTVWPVNDLQSFLPWVGKGVVADLLHRP